MTAAEVERFNVAVHDRYQIERELGRGGMATVYVAEDRRHQRKVAIKVLRADVAAGIDGAMFLREIQVTARLNHPHILPLHDSGAFEHLLYYVMPYVDGQSVRARLSRTGRLTLDEALRITAEVADALGYAHRQGVVHRDIKPENILMQGDHALVADFGIARVMAPSNAVTSELNRSTVAIGTPVYMSPEQVMGAAGVDGRSDIYSLGCVLFEMLAGTPPFQGDDAVSAAAKRFMQGPPRLSQSCPNVPMAVETAVARALALDAHKRFSTIEDFAASLTRLPAGLPVRTDGKGIIVLPFANLSADPENEYFADGLTDEIITDLAGVRALHVISRTSAMRLKRTDKSPRAIAQELDVQYVLEGSVRYTGDRLRVTAQLIDAGTDSNVWTEKYSGHMADVFAIQEEISRKIVGALKVQLSDDEDRRVAARPIENIPAYQCYLRARQEIYSWTDESLERATKQVDDAIGIVGENPLLLATKGLIFWMYVNGSVKPEEGHLERAADCAARALALDRESYLAIFVHGLVAAKRGDIENGLLDLTKAHDLAPADANVLTELCRYLATVGCEDDARQAADTLLRIDPLTPIGWHCAAAVDWFAGRFEQALPAVRHILDLAGPKSPLRVTAAWTLAAAGQRAHAFRLLDEFAAALPGSHYASLGLLFKHALEGDADRALAHVTPDLERAAAWQEHRARIIADSYALLGRTDRAIDWVETAVSRGLIHYPFLAVHDPFLTSVRGDARFERLLAVVKERWDAFQV
jgi:serine/threonine-protein kinase